MTRIFTVKGRAERLMCGQLITQKEIEYSEILDSRTYFKLTEKACNKHFRFSATQ
jgi:hypothetical protein